MRVALLIVVALVAFVAGAASMAGILFFGLPTGKGQVVQPSATVPQAPLTGPVKAQPNPTPSPTPGTTPRAGAGTQGLQATPTPRSGLPSGLTPGPTPQPTNAKTAPTSTPQGTPVDFELLVTQTEPPPVPRIAECYFAGNVERLPHQFG